MQQCLVDKYCQREEKVVESPDNNFGACKWRLVRKYKLSLVLLHCSGLKSTVV